MTCSAESGTCAVCRGGCERRPGWFLPGEAEGAAEVLGVSLAELFRTRLTVDYWYGDDRLSPTTFVLAPATVSDEPGTVSRLDRGGRCTFFVDERCQIHEAKPFECQQWWCEADHATLTPHVDVARAWRGKNQRAQIAELLGEPPELPPVTVGDVISFTLGLLDDIADRGEP